MPGELPSTNALLDHLDSLSVLAIGGTIEEVKSGQVLLTAGAPEVDVYFPITSVLSLMSTMPSGHSCEVAVVGREGMVGLAGVLATADSSSTCVVHVGGTCLRASASAVRAARNSSVAVRETLDRYTTARLIEVAQVAACNRLHPIGPRLARWLLMLHDRIDTNHLRISQQTIASSLGVHRPTVALELQRLHRLGAILYRSRIVRITDRARLESLACECHPALHAEYVRLFRQLPADWRSEEVGADGSGTAAIEALRQIAGRLLMSSLHEQAARQRADAATRAKDDFLALVSHELRTPLQAMLGWCALARLPNPPPGALTAIERNAKAQRVLIEDLLDSVRMNTDTLRVSRRELDPVSVVESAIETVQPAAETKEISLRLNVLNERAPVLADGDRLRQVMVNVLMNSVKFSHQGTSIETEVSSSDDAVEVRVIDHGNGISPSVLPHVFERFWQAPEGHAERRRGLGLGLSIARALVELHGGKIELASGGTGQGTTCRITLPRMRPTSTDSGSMVSP